MADLKLGNMTLMGNVKVPPSKSMAHRAIICASLSQGISKIENIVAIIERPIIPEGFTDPY